MHILTPNLSFNINAASRVLPDSKPITNLDILQHFPRTADKSLHFQQLFAQKIAEEFGFNTRYWCHKPWEPLDNARALTSESLAIASVQKLYQQNPSLAIDAYLLGSTTNKRFTGSQAAAVLGHLNQDAPAYDLKTGCSTSLATLHLAYALLALGYQQLVLTCAETLSKVIDPNNEKTWIGLADGAASLALERSPTGAFTIEKSFFSTQGAYVEAYTTQGIFPPTHHELDNVGYHLQGDEQLLKELAYEKYTQLIQGLLPTSEEREEIRWIITHQVNRKLIDLVLSEHGLSNKVLIWDADQIGNIGGASIIYTLARAVEDKLFSESGKLLLMSVGGGLSYAGQVIHYRGKEH
jgi:3-oxoacyl-[acyl-carrier-protein] synthase III